MNYLRTLGLAKNIAQKAPNFAVLTRLNSSDVGDIIHPPDGPIFEIPRPKSRDNESMEQRKARLVYQSRKRGMLENDLLLSTFIDKYLDGFNEQQIDIYDRLINGPSNDWDIYYWASDVKEIPAAFDTEVMQMLRLHCKNLNKESRIRQPDLD